MSGDDPIAFDSGQTAHSQAADTPPQPTTPEDAPPPRSPSPTAPLLTKSQPQQANPSPQTGTPPPPPGWQAPPAPPPPPPVLPVSPRRPWTGRITLACAALAAGLALAALIVTITHPTPPPPAPPAAPTYTPEQVAAAKTKTCAAAKLAIGGLQVNTNRANPADPDDALGWANFANGRAAYLSAALWLPKQVDPATPKDLKDAVSKLAATAGDGAALSISEDKTEENVRRSNEDIDTLNSTAKIIEKLCQ